MKNRKMGKGILVVGLVLYGAMDVVAQSVTYSHDAAKMNQITVGEIGSGSLTPGLYYQALHKSYSKSAASKNKLSDRSGGALDVAWAAEGGKITDKMGDFGRNINRILQTGGNGDDQSYWKEHYQMFQCAIRATQDAYMPNAQRKKQYLRIYTDVARKNEELIRYLVRLSNARKTSELLAATNQIENRKAQVVAAAMGRWRSAGWTTVDGRE